MATSDRRQRHRASLRREILDAASQLFVEEGFQRVTMRRIAERIEYSPTTIYLYFKDKNELLAAVCEATFSQLAAKLERLQKTAGTPLSYLREGLRTYVDFGLANPNQYTVTFLMPMPGVRGAEGVAGGSERSIGGLAVELLRHGVRACVESGDIQTPNVEMTSQALWAAVHGVTSLLITQQGFPFAARAVLVDHLIDSLIAGLKTPAAAPRNPVQPRSKKWDYFE
jgi:AcrR family transcriptional regulator